MKTLVVLSALAAIAIAGPTIPDDEITDFDVTKIGKRSPTFHKGHGHIVAPIHHVPVVHHTYVQPVIPHHLGLKKPLLFNQHHGHHGHLFRTEDEETEPHSAESKETKTKCMKEMEAKCDDEIIAKSSELTDGVQIEDVEDNISESEVAESLQMAKEAVNALQRKLQRAEQNSRMTQWKQGDVESDVKLQRDVETAKQALDHMQLNFGNLESMNVQMHTSAFKEADVQNSHLELTKSEKERIAQWKDAIENIEKNVELVKNIEDSFQHAEHTEMKSAALENSSSFKQAMSENQKSSLTSSKSANIESSNLKSDMESSASTLSESNAVLHGVNEHQEQSARSAVAQSFVKSHQQAHSSQGSHGLVQSQTQLGTSHNHHQSSSSLNNPQSSSSFNNHQSSSSLNNPQSSSSLNNHQSSSSLNNHQSSSSLNNHQSSSSLNNHQSSSSLNNHQSSSSLNNHQLSSSHNNHQLSSHNARELALGHGNIKNSRDDEHSMTLTEGKMSDKQTGLSSQLVKTMKSSEGSDLNLDHEKSVPVIDTTNLMKAADHQIQAEVIENPEKLEKSSLKTEATSKPKFEESTDNSGATKSPSVDNSVNSNVQGKGADHEMVMKSSDQMVGQSQQSEVATKALQHMSSGHQLEKSRPLHSSVVHGKSVDGVSGSAFLQTSPNGLHSDFKSSLDVPKSMSWKDASLHGSSRGAYGSGLSLGGGYGTSAYGAGASSGAVGVFPNAHVGGCAIPLMLSCSPNVVAGHLAKTHSSYSAPSYGSPSYRNSETTSTHSKRDITKIGSPTKVKRTPIRNLKQKF